MSLEAESMSMALIGFHNNHRIPETLGSFKLDDHNVEEWDDDSTDPGVKRRGRKEIGKWIDPDRNADIQFQRVEDSEKSGKGADRQRTEIIEGKAPDSSFRIVRSQCQFNNNNSESGTNETGSRLSSVMTSYQMSSSNGVRTTSKTTSNKSSSKTITVSSSSISGGGGGGRSLQSQSDDFENLKIAFQPLDSSTQREKLNMIRNSGTMGLKRRPPTRKHTRTTAATEDSSTNFHNSVDEIYEDDVNKNFSEQTSASLPLPKSNGDLSIVSIKNLSPKVRVGFPVEIQVELRSKLRGGGSSSLVSRSNEIAMNGDSNHESPLLNGDLYDTNSTDPIDNPTNSKILNFTLENEVTDQKSVNQINERRKSYAFESIHQKPNVKENEWKSKLYTPSSGSSTTNIYDKLFEKKIGDEKPLFPSNETPYSLLNNNNDNFTNDSLDSLSKSLESSPSPERSRKLIKLTNETEHFAEKDKTGKLKSETSSGRSNNRNSFFTNNLYEGSENFPNYRRNSVMGILSSGNNELYTRYSKPLLANQHSTLLDFNSFSQNNANKVTQTWISSIDGQKPSQTARDEYVTTSISATNDQFIKPQKKVEFCVTEVHFIPESGKFNIVKSDENKPSTVHLFRKKKRQMNSIINSETLNLPCESPENVNNDDSGYVEDELDIYAKTTNPYTFAFSNSNENLSDDTGSKDIENIILPNSCEELQIQRFLKQLKPSSSNSSTTTDSESSTESIDTLLKSTEIREKYDGNTVYENGSFVPYVIRQSLIDMNNRNGIKSLDPSDPNQISDNSSTTSTYSLPKSDHSRELFYNPFKLTGSDTTVGNMDRSPNITSVELIYSNMEANDMKSNHTNWSATNDTSRSRSKSENFLYRSSPERIPTPVMPSGLRTMPPYRNDTSTVSNPSLYDDGYSFDRHSSKPPTPILPIQFSTFEKTGAALRERFYAKNPKCLECSKIDDDTRDDDQIRSKPVEEISPSSIYLSSEENFQERLKRISRNNFQISKEDSETDISPSIENNIDDFSLPRSTVARSLTFPKSNRPEPEWVLKAKLKAISREARVEDWSLLGSKAATSPTNKTEEPPWISELNYRRNRKNHLNYKSEDDQNQRTQPQPEKSSHVYPWNRTTHSKEKDLHPQNPGTATGIPGGNNKSIVDLNRDSDSILIEPIQIEVKSEKFVHAKSKPNLENFKLNNDEPNVKSQPDRQTNETRSRYKKQHEPVERVPLQTLTSENKTSAKSKPKPLPKSPERNIASRKVQTTTFSASVDRKIPHTTPTTSPIEGHRKEREQLVSQSRPSKPEKSTPIIHRHPTVKISKLPVKNVNSNRKHAASPEGKHLEKNRTKLNQNDMKRSSKDKEKDKQNSAHILQGGESKGKVRAGQGAVTHSSAKMSHKH